MSTVQVNCYMTTVQVYCYLMTVQVDCYNVDCLGQLLYVDCSGQLLYVDCSGLLLFDDCSRSTVICRLFRSTVIWHYLLEFVWKNVGTPAILEWTLGWTLGCVCTDTRILESWMKMDHDEFGMTQWYNNTAGLASVSGRRIALMSPVALVQTRRWSHAVFIILVYDEWIQMKWTNEVFNPWLVNMTQAKRFSVFLFDFNS
jgi:hypothetical protein